MFYAVNKAMVNYLSVNNFVGLLVFFPRVVLFRVAILHNVIVAAEYVLGCLECYFNDHQCGKGCYFRWCDEHRHSIAILMFQFFMLYYLLLSGHFYDLEFGMRFFGG